MDERTPHTSFRARQVAAALRRYREQAGLSCHQVAAQTTMSQSKVSRLERGHTSLREEDVIGLLMLYKVADAERDALLGLLRDGERRGWWTEQPKLPRVWTGLMDIEDEASRIQNFELTVVPGLLQTPDYTRAIIEREGNPLTRADLDTLVAARSGRQTLLARDNAPQLVAVIDESLLHRRIGEPGVMRRQLQHLVSTASRPNVLLQVVPLAAGAYPGLRGPFSIVDFGEDSEVVYIENQATGLFLEERAEVQSYRTALAAILSHALAPGESLELIGSLTDSVWSP